MGFGGFFIRPAFHPGICGRIPRAKEFPLKHAFHTLVGMAVLLAAMGCKDKSSAPSMPEAASADLKSTGKVAPSIKPSENAVRVDLFVMSQCPYGVQALDGMIPAVKKLGSEVDLHLEFVGNKAADGKLESMHGQAEVTGDKAQICAAEIAPDTYLDFVQCQNKDYRRVATNWADCAKKTKIDVQQLGACIEGEQGERLLGASFDRARSKGARGSPTIFIGNQRYSKGRSATSFLRAICNAHKAPKSVPACAGLPEIKPVNVTLIGDKRCGDSCQRDIATAKRSLGNVFGVPPVYTELDYGDEAGKALYAQVAQGNTPLPLILVDKSVQGDPDAVSQLRRALRKTNHADYQQISLRASWDPICVTDSDCALDQCKGTMSCRKEEPGKLELFVMSQCPYGVKALDAMPEVLKNFDNKIKFEVHFIANGTAKGGFTALHGQPEVDENIRELCAIKHYGADYKFMDYILCRNKNIRSNAWEGCTGSNGIDTAVMKACFEGDEGKLLHEEDIKIGNALRVSGSPTWIVNGKHKFSGLDAETIRANFCKHNAGFKGCENTLSKNSTQVQGGCGN